MSKMIMTINEEKTILNLELHDEGHDEFTICGNLGNDECMIMLVLPKGMEEEARAFVDEINKLIQPKATSTDIEEKELVSLNIKIATKDLVKRVDAIIPEMDLHSKISLRGKIIRLIAEELAPHLSNKSELKKEAVREFVDWNEDEWNVVGFKDYLKAKAQKYLSSDEKNSKSGGKEC